MDGSLNPDQEKIRFLNFESLSNQLKGKVTTMSPAAIIAIVSAVVSAAGTIATAIQDDEE